MSDNYSEDILAVLAEDTVAAFKTAHAALVAREKAIEAARYISVVFDGPPSHESGRFVEVEDDHGNSINAGEWVERADSLWELRIPTDAALRERIKALEAERDDVREEWFRAGFWRGVNGRYLPPGMMSKQFVGAELADFKATREGGKA